MTYAPTLWERLLCRVLGHRYWVGGSALLCRRCLAVVPFPPPPPLPPDGGR